DSGARGNLKNVVAGTAGERVCTPAADNRVIAASARQDVIAGPAIDHPIFVRRCSKRVAAKRSSECWHADLPMSGLEWNLGFLKPCARRVSWPLHFGSTVQAIECRC